MHRLIIIAGIIVTAVVEKSATFVSQTHGTQHARVVAALVIMVPTLLIWLVVYRAKASKRARPASQARNTGTGYPFNTGSGPRR